MRRLGIFVKPNGVKYDLYYLLEEQLAQAIGSRKHLERAAVIVELPATSEEDAVAKLVDKLSPGGFYLHSVETNSSE